MRVGRTKELTHHADDRLHHGVALDEHNANDMLVIARNEDGMVADEHAHGRLVGNLAKLHGFEDDRIPSIITNPMGLLGAALCGVGVPIEDRHDSVVAQDAFNSAVCHVMFPEGGR